MADNYIFESDRLGFRLWHEEDHGPFAEMNQDEDVMKYFPNKLSLEESNGFIERIMNHHILKGYGLYALELKATNEFIGFIGFASPSFEADFTPCIEIGWRLDKKYWHKGYATEGAKACLKYGSDVFGFEEIVSFTSQVNTPSIGVMKNIGMTYVRSFEHPKIDKGHPLKEHVLYKIEL